MGDVRRFLPVAVVVLLLLAGVVWMLGGSSEAKTVTAYFPRTVSVYEGSDVRVLGVAVGQVHRYLATMPGVSTLPPTPNGHPVHALA